MQDDDAWRMSCCEINCTVKSRIVAEIVKGCIRPIQFGEGKRFGSEPTHGNVAQRHPIFLVGPNCHVSSLSEHRQEGCAMIADLSRLRWERGEKVDLQPSRHCSTRSQPIRSS